jgi:transcriptional regulator GlxA family with amidase domain
MKHPVSIPTASGAARGHLSVAFLLLPDFTLSTFSAFVDALRIAADESDGSRQLHCRWTIIGPERVPVSSSCGVEITPWETFGDPGRFDYTIVVGGLLRGQKRTDRRIVNYLRQVDSGGGALVGACTGSFALARAGLMKGYRCCVHWCHLQEFVAEFPDHRVEGDVVFLVDGNRITCAGGQSAIDVAVHLVERHCGRSIALKVTTAMIVAAARSPKDPQPHPEAKWFREIKDTLVQRAILLMQQQPAGGSDVVHEIAAQLGVSVRTLVRGFEKHLTLSPTEFFRAQRMAQGRWELLNTHKPISSIALDNGFSDASHFIRLYRKYYGVTPATAREIPQSESMASNRKSPRRSARATTPLEKILFSDVLSLSAIDWPTEGPGAHKLGSHLQTRPQRL